MAGQSRDNALDHVIVVVFENRSLDNVLGRLYGPADGKTFDGVLGKDLSNPISVWAEHGDENKVVPYTVPTDMDSPNPDAGEEYPHPSTQLFDIQDEQNRFNAEVPPEQLLSVLRNFLASLFPQLAHAASGPASS